MKCLKVFGLAAVAAVALMAFVGAGTASATTLCTTDDSPGCTMVYTAGTTVDFSLMKGTLFKLTSPVGTAVATCTENTVKGATENTSETWVDGNISQLTWGGCDTTVKTLVNGKFDLMWINGTHNGILRGTDTEITVVLNPLSCIYGTLPGGTDLGTVTGGEEPILKIETKVKKVAGSFACPVEPTIDAQYVATEPHTLYFVS